MANGKLSVIALNVVTHPHSVERYAQLLSDTYKLKKLVKIHGERFGKITALHGHTKPRERSGKWQLQGTVATFVNIDPADQWFNTETDKAAEPHETNRVPKHLRPTMRQFEFEFSPHNHRLVMMSEHPDGELTPNLIEKFWARQFDLDEIVSVYGDVDVRLLAEADKVNQIVNSENLKSFKVRIKRPNPEDMAGAHADWLKRLDESNAGSQDLALTAQSGKTLKLPDYAKSMAKVAGEGNGYVIGKEAGKPLISSKDHPQIQTEEFDTGKQNVMSVFERLVATFLPRA